MRELQRKVVAPALGQLLPIPRELVGGQMRYRTQIARDNSHNSLCFEMRLSFALSIGATFERNVRLWLAQGQEELRPKIEKADRTRLYQYVAELKGPSAASACQEPELSELWELVSTARHGDGPAAKRLRILNPDLWAHNDAGTQAAYDRVGLRAFSMRVQDADIERYFGATIGFWESVSRS